MNPPTADQLRQQIVWLFVLAVPVACVAWTVTHEEVFREPREYCQKCSKSCRNIMARKFFYLFTCEYCFSHYITALFLIISHGGRRRGGGRGGRRGGGAAGGGAGGY